MTKRPWQACTFQCTSNTSISQIFPIEPPPPPPPPRNTLPAPNQILCSQSLSFFTVSPPTGRDSFVYSQSPWLARSMGSKHTRVMVLTVTFANKRAIFVSLDHFPWSTCLLLPSWFIDGGQCRVCRPRSMNSIKFKQLHDKG